MQENLDFEITQYDPAIPQFSEYPVAHDIVVCTDVLEHIEPEFLDNVLTEIHDLSKRLVFLTVATRKACKTLADGRNAHLIIENEKWWMEKLTSKFKILEKFGTTREFTVIGEPL